MSDYINREAAIAAAFSANGIGNSEYRNVCDIAERLRLIPAADVAERKHGEWIGGELGHCSCCGHEGCASDIWNDGQKKFCPNCGARLDGDSDV